MATYVITRDCCSSGNCVYCMDRAPYGQPVRVEQTTTTDPKRAEQIKANWRRLKARILETGE